VQIIKRVIKKRFTPAGARPPLRSPAPRPGGMRDAWLRRAYQKTSDCQNRLVFFAVCVWGCCFRGALTSMKQIIQTIIDERTEVRLSNPKL
jgi:hypothetical protein